jgi:hypothetical protein
VIPSVAYEESVVKYLPYCFRVLEEIGSGPTVVVALTLVKTRGLVMGVDNYGFKVGYPIDSDTIILPETVVESLSTPVGEILKPLFDFVWNASGYPSSRNFDSEGNCVNRR